jgi:hypothetical protein
VIQDSSVPLTSHQRQTATEHARQLLDDYSLQLRRRYERNAAAGRLIDDDGDEHGCPTKGNRKGCRLIQEELTLDPDE